MTNLQRLRQLLADVFLLDPQETQSNLRRDDVPTWDSLGVVSLAVGVKDTFGYHFTPEEATGIRCVQDIVDLLETRGSASLSSPIRWTIDDLVSADLGSAAVTSTRSVSDVVYRKLGLKSIGLDQPLPEDLGTWVVVGGGTLMDEVKWRCRGGRPRVRLVAVPSLWGSGSEASPVVVLNRNGHKEIHVDATFVPDIRVVWPELARSIPAEMAKAAAGDVWAHALEGFLSPLGSDRLKSRQAELLRHLSDLPLDSHPAWFDASAQAATMQAESSVGLVHGMAHTLEGPARKELPDRRLGHAALCATFLFPVMCFNRQAGGSWECLSGKFDVPADRIMDRFQRLFDRALYVRLLPLLERLWKQILRDPCTRTNSALVRPSSLSYFTDPTFP